MIEDDNDNAHVHENDFIENNSTKINFNIASYTISTFNDDNSTYLGVKSVNEEQSIKGSENMNNKQKNNGKKVKKKKSFSSIIESSNSESDSFNIKKKSSSKITKQNKVEKENNNNNIKKDDKKKNKINEIETLFEWNGGGESVYITGSFCDWKDFFKMNKNNNGIFSLRLLLPRGFHQYKFKVDENWEFSKNHPKFEENDNINNYVDTTDYEIENETKNNNN